MKKLYLLSWTHRSGQRFDALYSQVFVDLGEAIERAKDLRVDDAPGATRSHVWELRLPSEVYPSGFLFLLQSFERRVTSEIGEPVKIEVVKL